MGTLAQRIANRPLLAAFTLSFAAHASVLAVRFVDPDALRRRMTDVTLEVILVNARSDARPSQPQALAQANLDGGGSSDDGRRRSPLPVIEYRDGDLLDGAMKRLREVEAEQMRRLALLGDGAALALTLSKDDESDARSDEDLRTQLARLQAEIAQQVSDYQKRPRRHHFMPSVSEYRYARYVEDWRSWVERIGNEHYPEEARGHLYGELRMTVVLRRDGTVAESMVERSSGSQVLDRAARRIVALSTPFVPFPPEIARDTDQIEISRTWKFTNDLFATQSASGSANVKP
jgi:periplasmic protein TonB